MDEEVSGFVEKSWRSGGLKRKVIVTSVLKSRRGFWFDTRWGGGASPNDAAIRDMPGDDNFVEAIPEFLGDTKLDTLRKRPEEGLEVFLVDSVAVFSFSLLFSPPPHFYFCCLYCVLVQYLASTMGLFVGDNNRPSWWGVLS